MQLRDLWRKLTRRGKADEGPDLRPTHDKLADGGDGRYPGSLSRWADPDEPKH